MAVIINWLIGNASQLFTEDLILGIIVSVYWFIDLYLVKTIYDYSKTLEITSITKIDQKRMKYVMNFLFVFFGGSTMYSLVFDWIKFRNSPVNHLSTSISHELYGSMFSLGPLFGLMNFILGFIMLMYSFLSLFIVYIVLKEYADNHVVLSSENANIMQKILVILTTMIYWGLIINTPYATNQIDKWIEVRYYIVMIPLISVIIYFYHLLNTKIIKSTNPPPNFHQNNNINYTFNLIMVSSFILAVWTLIFVQSSSLSSRLYNTLFYIFIFVIPITILYQFIYSITIQLKIQREIDDLVGSTLKINYYQNLVYDAIPGNGKAAVKESVMKSTNAGIKGPTKFEIELLNTVLKDTLIRFFKKYNIKLKEIDELFILLYLRKEDISITVSEFSKSFTIGDFKFINSPYNQLEKLHKKGYVSLHLFENSKHSKSYKITQNGVNIVSELLNLIVSK